MTKHTHSPQLIKRCQRVLYLLDLVGEMHTSTLADRLGCSRRTLDKAVNFLKAQRLIESSRRGWYSSVL